MTVFKARVKQQWKFHIKMFRSIADWTTYVYLIIPSMLFLFYLYKETILQGEYGFITYISAPFFIFFLLSVARIGYLRTFVAAADRLFLMQHQRSFSQLKRYAFSYSVVIQSLFVLFCLLILSPVLQYYYHLTTLGMIQLACSMVLQFLLSKMIDFTSIHKWMKFIIQLLITAILASMVLYTNLFIVSLTVAIIVASVVYYEKRHIRSNMYFDQQVNAEREAYFRWQGRIFIVSPELKSMEPAKHTLKAPRFLKGRLFMKSNDAMAELMLKALIRDKRYRWGYVQLIAVTIPVYAALPLWGDMLCIIMTYFMLNSWLQSVMNEIKGHAIFRVIQVHDEVWNVSYKRLKNYFVNYVLIFISVIVLLCMFL